MLAQRQKDIQLYTELMDEVKENVAKGTAQECFATHLLEEQAGLGMSDLEIAYTAGSPFGAGVETVSDGRARLSTLLPLSNNSTPLTKPFQCPAVGWFTRLLLPRLRQVWPHLRAPRASRTGPCRGPEPTAIVRRPA